MSNGGNQELQQEREERELEEAQSELPLWMVAAVPDRFLALCHRLAMYDTDIGIPPPG